MRKKEYQKTGANVLRILGHLQKRLTEYAFHKMLRLS